MIPDALTIRPTVGHHAGDAARSYRFDAFLSYAHEDVRTVEWLERYLATTWVPGKRRRRIFRDQTRMVAGELPQELRHNLRDSRFLIVCCSPAAAASTWVEQEIVTFLQEHGSEPDVWSRVLACQVGDPHADRASSRPASIVSRERTTGREMYLPDLRGDPAGARGRERRGFEREAAALLARLVDLRDRQAVLALVARRLRVMAVGAAVLLLALGAMWQAWRSWLATPDGALFTATHRMLAPAGTRTIDDIGALLAGARGLGALQQRAKAERLATYVADQDFRAVIRGVALAAEHPPACRRARSLLEAMDDASAASWPQAHLSVTLRCGIDLRSKVRRSRDTRSWLDKLIDAGDRQEAEALLAREPLPSADRLSADVSLAGLGSTPAPAVLDADIGAWRNALPDALSMLVDANDLLETLDRADALTSPVATRVAAVALSAADRLDPDVDAHWMGLQRLAAHLAASAHRGDAAGLLALGARRFADHPDYAPGWAWRGLALLRLGDAERGQEAFAESTRCSLAVVPSGRDWRELVEVELAYVLADRWVDAFATVGLVGNEVTMVRHYAVLVDLWAARVGRLPWPWRLGGIFEREGRATTAE